MTDSPRDTVFIIHSDRQASFLLERLVRANNVEVVCFPTWAAAHDQVEKLSPKVAIVGDKVQDSSSLDCARMLINRLPFISVVLLVSIDQPEVLKQAMRIGVSHYLRLPLRTEEVTTAVQESLALARRRREWILQRSSAGTGNLERRLDELQVLAQLGHSITASLDSDSVLTAIVDAAVRLTKSEEGQILLLDEESGELYVRASRNFSDEFVHTFRLRAQDSLAGTVLSTGKPAILDNSSPQKIKTAYLVHSLAYVPLQFEGKTFGVLGVDNRTVRLSFTQHDIDLLQALAEYAVIALQNAKLYSAVSQERRKFEGVLASVRDGMIILDTQNEIIFVNKIVLSAFQLPEGAYLNRPMEEVFEAVELVSMVTAPQLSLLDQTELTAPDGRIFRVQVTPVPEVGRVITLHDITYMRRLDRLKSEFVSTVSHDLRSPLTAILGYVELIERAGSVNDMQRDFIKRVQASVHHITSLVNDLLNLGRIEAGFDNRRETVYLDQIIRYAVDSSRSQQANKTREIKLRLPDKVPPLFANPVQMRQLIDNLIDNAIKYTPSEGVVMLRVDVEEDQIIFRVQDNGIGIPSEELPFVFDKFYRASNVGDMVPGTGLGLAIVKTIVEAHQGRIWIESTSGVGTTVTIVLPLVTV